MRPHDAGCYTNTCVLNYNHLYYFHTAASEGSIARAAERLSVSQATVSEQVRSLERTLSMALFERHPGGLKLTDAGRLAYEHTAVMFRAGERLAEALTHDGRTLPRALRVGLTGAVGRATSTDFLLPLLELEAVMPSVRTGDAADLPRDLPPNQPDIVPCQSRPAGTPRQGLTMTVVDHITLLAVVGSGVTPSADWSNLKLIHYRPTSSFRWDVETHLETNSLHPTVAAETDDTAFMVESATRGSYVAFVPRSCARDSIVAGRVTVIGKLRPPAAGVHALYTDASTAELAKRAVDLLVRQAASSAD